MKVTELLKVLNGKEDFEIKLIEEIESDSFPRYKKFDIEISDIGFSEKIISINKIK